MGEAVEDPDPGRLGDGPGPAGSGDGRKEGGEVVDVVPARS